MSAVVTLAGRELKDGLRNRWIVALTALLAVLALTLAFLGSAPVGTTGAAPLEVTVVSLASLTIFLVPLVALLLAFDAVVGEREKGTLLLLLAYPVSRTQIVLGKFTGHVLILLVATVIGYGIAGAAVAWREGGAETSAILAFASLVGSSVLLGAAFAAVGLLVSVVVRARGTAAALAVAIWLLLVLLYDLAILGLLVADKGRTVSPGLLGWLLLLNPADAFRLLNLTGFEGTRVMSGMAGLAEDVRLPPWTLLAGLAAWIAVPLGLAVLVFRRREP